MSKEIFLPHGITGLTTLYAVVRRPSDGFWWYTVTPAFEAFNSGHVAAGYAVALTEQGTTGNYYADFPAGITTAGRYEVVARKQAGGSPAWPADAVVGTGDVLWSGSAVVVPVAATSAGKAPATLAAGDVTGNLPSDVRTVADGSITSAKFTVAAPSAGLPAGILEKIDRVFRRFFKKADRTPTQLKTYADDGTTVLTTQAVSDDGAGNESQGAAS